MHSRTNVLLAMLSNRLEVTGSSGSSLRNILRNFSNLKRSMILLESTGRSMKLKLRDEGSSFPKIYSRYWIDVFKLYFSEIGTVSKD